MEEARRSGVTGGGVSGRMLGSAVCVQTKMGTKESLFIWETLAEAEACPQAVIEWEEDRDREPVRADDTTGKGVRGQREAFTLLSSVHPGLLQAGEGRGPADDSGSLENAPRHWWDRYRCSSFPGVIHETHVWGLGLADILVSKADVVAGLKELTVYGGAQAGPGAAVTKPGSPLSVVPSPLSVSSLVPSLSSTPFLPGLALGGGLRR